MTTPTAQELTLLREQPHKTKLWLSIFEPQIVFQAQVNDAGAAKGDVVVTYDNVTFGNFLAIGPGMTLYVGTSAGARDKGSIFTYKRDATTITVGENSHINWADDDYLTIVNFHQIWPVYPRYTQSGTDITVYKVYDTAYVDQNEDLGSLLVMGSNYAGFIDPSTGTAQVYWDGSETENVIGTTGSSFTWSFEGASNMTGSSAITPGWVTYDTPGHYRVLLRVQTPGGNAEIGVRHVSIYDRPEYGTNVPILSWGLNDLKGSRDEGGYTASMWIKEDVSSVVDGALVVLFADDTYGTTEQSIGGNSPQRESIVFVGYIIDGSIDYDYQTSTVTFEVGSPSEIMKLGEAFSVSVEDSTDPSGDATSKGGDPWFYLQDLSIKTALYHYIRWHSSVYTLMDVRYVGDDFDIQFFDADRTSLYDALNTLLKSAVYGGAVCDRQGALYFEIDSAAINNAASNLNTNMFIDNNDWMGAPDIAERYTGEVSYLEMGGVSYVNLAGGGTGTFSALLAAAPGDTPAYRGKNMKLSGLAASSQSQINTLVGNVWENMNAQFPEVNLNLVGNYRNIDIAPQEIVTMTLQPGDTFRGLTWTGKAFTPRGMSWRYDAELGIFLPSVSLREVTQGNAGQTIDIPVVPPDGGYEQPPPIIPPIVPPIPIPSVGGASTFFAPALAGVDISSTLINFDQSHVLASQGILGQGIYLATDVQTTAEGWFAVPLGATSVTVYGVIDPRSGTGDIVCLNSATYHGCGETASTTDTGNLTITPNTSADIDCIAPLSFSVSPADLVQMRFTRYGADGSDDYDLMIFFYGWLVVTS